MPWGSWGNQGGSSLIGVNVVNPLEKSLDNQTLSILDATTTNKGAVQLTSDATDTTSENKAMTQKGVASAIAALLTTNSLTSSANSMTSNVNGVSDSADIVNSNALSLTGTALKSTVNGVDSVTVDVQPPLTNPVTSSTSSATVNQVAIFTGAGVQVTPTETNTAFNKNFETSTANIKMDGAVSVGSSGNVVNSDHVHPSDTSKQNIIATPTANDLVSVNNAGQVIDSGISVSTVSTTSSDTVLLTSKATQTAIANAITGSENLRGGYDASSNTFPTAGGTGSAGAIEAGNYWYITVQGTLGGEVVPVDSSITALINAPGQTPDNWLIVQDAVNSVFGRTGLVTAQTGDYNFSQISGTNAIIQGGTGANSRQAAINNLVDTQAAKTFLAGDGSNVGMRTLALTDLPDQPNNTFLGNVSGGSLTPIALSISQMNAALAVNTNIQYVTPNGNNSNNGFSFKTGVATLSQALTNLGNVAGVIFVAPKVGGYPENTTITAQNINIVALSSNRAVDFTGTLTFAHTASNIQLNNIGVANLVHNNAGALYINGGNIVNSLVSSGAGYLQTNSTNLQAGSATISITGPKAVTFTEGSVLGSITINNANAVVSVLNCLNALPIVVTAGVCGVNNTTVYSASAGTNAISVAAGAALYMTNSTALVPGTNTPALINVAAGGFYSFDNCVYSDSSTISGTVLTRKAKFDNIDISAIANNAVTNAKLAQIPANRIKGNNTVETANATDLTATQVTAMLDSFVGDTGLGGTKGLVPAPAAGDGVANKYLNATGGWSVPAGGGAGNIPIYMSSRNFSADINSAIQTITNSAGNVNWGTVAPLANRVIINNNLINPTPGSFTVGTNSITILQPGAYLINLSLDIAQSNALSNYQVYTQLVQNGTVIAVNQDQPGSQGNYTNNSISIIINCLANDVIDFRSNVSTSTPNVFIQAYTLNIVKQSDGVQSVNNVLTGTIIQHVSPTLTGYLQCDGNSYNRSDYNSLFALLNTEQGTATLTIATPCVVTKTNHGLTTGQKVYFTTTGTLPTGITANTTYWINVTGVNTFNLATSYANLIAGIYIATSGTQSGVHTAFLTIGSVSSATTFNTPDYRGRVLANANALNGVGKFTGTETQTLTIANLPSHNHNIIGDSGSGIGSGSTSDRVLLNTDGDVRNVFVKTTELTGSGTAHNNMQPTEFVYFHIKY
jgi:microcystin-dependent protein